LRSTLSGGQVQAIVGRGSPEARHVIVTLPTALWKARFHYVP
jgi:hypothetical protein